MSMSRKHYEAIAKAISATACVVPEAHMDTLRIVAATLGGVFAADNDAYDHDKFLSACFPQDWNRRPGGVLCLSHDEAQALRDVCARIGGSPDATRRKHMNRIAWALHENYPSFDTSDLEGEIIFLERNRD